MATELSVTGQTTLSWSLSEANNPTSYSASAQQRSTRSIANGTGPGQANVAWSGTVAITGTNQAQINIGNIQTYPFNGYLVMGMDYLKEMLVEVTTGPTGGYVVISTTGVSPTAPINFPVGVGGQLHFCDYSAGMGISSLTYTDFLQLRSAVTGTYSVDVTFVGVGGYLGEF